MNKRFTTYNKATSYFNNNLILCNEITSIDYDLDYYFEDENGNPIEIYQFYLTDCSEHEVEILQTAFNLLFAYSEKLDLFVLCVDHCGTSWDGVSIEVLDDDIPDYNL